MFEAIGSLVGAGLNYLGGQKNLALQKAAMKKGIQWKVADAKKAGIHPLYALGAPAFNPSPVNFGDMASAGQDIGRALDAGKTFKGKVDEFTAATQKLQIRRMELENNLLASQVAKSNQPGNPPTIPDPGGQDPHLISGQGNSAPTVSYTSPVVKNIPQKRTAPDPRKPHQDPAAVSDYMWAKTRDGYVRLPSTDAKQQMEDMIIPEMQWSYRNVVKPYFQEYGPGDVPYPAPAGMVWKMKPDTQEFYLAPIKYRPYPRGNRHPGIHRRR
jgi:hypothetical protein